MKEKVLLYTGGLKIEGTIHLSGEGIRVSDYLNRSTNKFIPLTDVTFYGKEGSAVKTQKFVCINKDSISIVEEKGEYHE